MRNALLTAQKMANTMVSEAAEQKETMLADAEMEARARLGKLHDEIIAGQEHLNQIKKATREFTAQIRSVCDVELRALEALPDLAASAPEPAPQPVQAARTDTADIAALSEKIVSSYDLGREEAVPAPQPQPQPQTQTPAGAEATRRFPAIKPKKPAAEEASPFPSVAPAPPAAPEQQDDGAAFAEAVGMRQIRLADLKFGRNYRADEDT